jgi:hypothetical protein
MVMGGLLKNEEDDDSLNSEDEEDLDKFYLIRLDEKVEKQKNAEKQWKEIKSKLQLYMVFKSEANEAKNWLRRSETNNSSVKKKN